MKAINYIWLWNSSDKMAHLVKCLLYIASRKAWVWPRHPCKKLGMEVLVIILLQDPCSSLDSQTNLNKPQCNPVTKPEKGGKVPPTNRTDSYIDRYPIAAVPYPEYSTDTCDWWLLSNAYFSYPYQPSRTSHGRVCKHRLIKKVKASPGEVQAFIPTTTWAKA